ncbi:hypothetical protein DAETH_09750 [Deinococcus aetherius]|uniref:Tyr recombinase domain-containing protein n=1 Tax=Deinococcus aetherius TaxID=200252 RepID=A0ABM8AB80_9DEIO|nr:hypothetical protein DAETH_09750 [Deinococcus aetherius]
MGWIVDPPLTPNMRRRLYQESVAELVDRRGLQSKVVRDLIVRYLEELEPTLDYSSLCNLTQRLTRFWHWIETYSPGIDTLRLPPDVARAWKKAVIDTDRSEGQKRDEQMFYTVRNFYMDLREWCVHRPDEWSGHLYPSPITDSDIAVFNSTSRFHNQRARMHERIRRLAPHLTRLIGWLRRRFTEVRAIREQLCQVAVGDQFEVNGVRYERLGPNGLTVFGLQSKILYFRRADQPKAYRRSIEEEEEVAFWAWAGLEVLRLTGLRIEECLELTDLSLRKLTLASGETVVILNIAPSKTDRERMIPVSKELLAVLAQIRRRVAGPDGVVPSTVQYDRGERVMSASLPFLFLRRRHGRQCHVGATFLRDQLELACAQANLQDERGEPVRFVLHDFRRLFATGHVNEGLPVHIVAWMLGHQNLNTTMGYVAVYDLEAHQAYHQHLARRRSERPAHEYGEPTKAELEEFESHFRRRQLALGNCYRPYQTPCAHEHACVRCPMLRMDPDQMPRLLEIERDTIRLMTEARANDWVGEVAGLELTLDGIRDKKLQVERIQAGTQ